MEILLENVRSFSGKNIINITPLTILVGENSSGKTAFLSSIFLMSNAKRFPLRPAFNQPPFELGDYDSIATHKRGGSHADYFAFGFKKKVKDKYISAKANYHEINGHVRLKAFELVTDSGYIKIKGADPMKIDAVVNLPKKYGKYKVQIKGTPDEILETSDIRTFFISSILPIIMDEIEHKSKSKKNNKKKQPGFGSRFEATRVFIEGTSELLEHIILFKDSPLAIAPIRSKPQRTYDTYDEAFDPEGSHIPLRLVRIHERKGKTYYNLRNALKKFGRDSGLFDDIIMKRLGKKTSSAFQVFVKTGNQEINIVDVGYGVSQCLPIIVQSVMARKEQPILLQQPEVHLHPKAQAALGSLFIELVAKHNNTLLIETHSDYLIDRIRMEVAKGKIDPSMVSILYFERPLSRSVVFEIGVNENGNIRGAPASYRSFFLKEELKLLSRGGKR